MNNLQMHYGFFIPDHSHCRVAQLTYDNYINGSGFSGTEASLLEIAHGLEKRGHKITIVTAETDKSVFTSLDFFTPLFFLTSAVKQWVPLLRHDCIVAVWLHCYVPDTALREFKSIVAPRRFILIAVSDTVARHVFGIAPVHVVPNGINKAVWTAPLRIARGKHHVFIATYERGGVIAAVVARKLGKKLAIASYYHQLGISNPIPSLSKRDVRGLLETADIFVYPLVLPNGSVHHDTYACCVHEAMASGVIVVTWDVACFRDVYPPDLLVLVPPLPFKGYNPRGRSGVNPALASAEAVARLCDAVVALDRDPLRKESIRARAREWALKNTWDESVDAFTSAMIVV